MPADAPVELLPLVAGANAEVEVEDVSPRAPCFVRFDVATLALRWAWGSSNAVFAHLLERVKSEVSES